MIIKSHQNLGMCLSVRNGCLCWLQMNARQGNENNILINHLMGRGVFSLSLLKHLGFFFTLIITAAHRELNVPSR